MSAALPFKVHSVSVVVTAQSHNPSILTGEFLMASGIVPKEWVIAESLNIPPLSLVRFQNSIQWTLDESRLVVNEICESPIKDAYQIHESVTEYLNKVSYVPYRSLGLNWILYSEHNNPREWLTRQFLKTGAWTNVYQQMNMAPRFMLRLDDAVLTLAFGDQVTLQKGTTSAIAVDCNVHHEGPLNATELQQFISQWLNRQKMIMDVLGTLSGDNT